MTARDTWVRPTVEQVVQALQDAMYLVSQGWVQGTAYSFTDGRDCYCIMGAVAEVCGTIRLTHPVMWGDRLGIMGEVVPGAWLRDAVTAALVAAMPSRYPTPAAYNDAHGRTRAEVVMLFNKAIEIVRSQAVAA